MTSAWWQAARCQTPFNLMYKTAPVLTVRMTTFWSVAHCWSWQDHTRRHLSHFAETDHQLRHIGGITVARSGGQLRWTQVSWVTGKGTQKVDLKSISGQVCHCYELVVCLSRWLSIKEHLTLVFINYWGRSPQRGCGTQLRHLFATMKLCVQATDHAFSDKQKASFGFQQVCLMYSKSRVKVLASTVYSNLKMQFLWLLTSSDCR